MFAIGNCRIGELKEHRQVPAAWAALPSQWPQAEASQAFLDVLATPGPDLGVFEEHPTPSLLAHIRTDLLLGSRCWRGCGRQVPRALKVAATGGGWLKGEDAMRLDSGSQS